MQNAECHDTTNATTGAGFTPTYGSTTTCSSVNTLMFPQEFVGEFRGDQNQFQTFNTQCEMFMACRPMEFSTDHTKMTFVLTLLKEQATT